MAMFAASLWSLEVGPWHVVFAGVALVLCIAASGHAVLYKRDSRSAIGWVGFIWLAPLAGAALYFILGVNRIRRRAILLRSDLERYRAHAAQPECSSEELHRHLPGHTGHLNMLARVVGGVVERPLLPGNRIDPLVNGDQAFPAMLEAIQQARQTISFCTYIFDRDEIGLAFARALGDATRRGVEVRVLIDATGTRYSWPSILHALRREGVRHARFLPSFALGHLTAMNLRTHRKILVADGRVGFTGGMNIRIGHCVQRQPRRPGAGHPLPRPRSGGYPIAGSLCGRLAVYNRRDLARRDVVSQAGNRWASAGARSAGWPGRGLREAALDAVGGARHRASLDSDRDPLFSARPGGGLRAEPGCDAGRAGGYYSARQKQSAVRPLGFTRDVVAGARTRVPNLADPASLRSLETHARG